MPTFLSVEPADVCQLSCPQCPVGCAGKNRVLPDGRPTVDRQSKHTSSTHYLDLQHFQHILAQTRGYVHTIQFFFQGEPLLNPQLPEMIQLAHQARIYTIVSTNAQALTPLLAEKIIQAGLDRIIVSIDGLSEESYTAYRQGGSLNKALQGLIDLRNAKNQLGAHTHIELQCLRLKSNEHEWALFQRSYRQMGADSLSLKTAQFYDYEHGNSLMPTDQQYSRYQQMEDGNYMSKNRLYIGKTQLFQKLLHRHACKRLLMGCVITVHGNVLPCCFDKSHQHVMGNLFNETSDTAHSTLRAIWHNDDFRRFRHQVRLSRQTFPICMNCTE
ncbi:MAG: SPASM domain-containing protein [Paludibacteraceae bacterium]|nr:SPASM domain-containing protein [Paludibacteraceae bacterium]